MRISVKKAMRIHPHGGISDDQGLFLKQNWDFPETELAHRQKKAGKT